MKIEMKEYIPSHPDKEAWDAIVIGTGMGGSTAGYALAKEGLKVLFIEKGKNLFDSHDRGNGLMPTQKDEDPQSRLGRGMWPLPLEGSTTFGKTTFFAPLGCGTGGSTSLYAAQLERMQPMDFAPKANYPDVPDANLPGAWPLSYEEFVPYYRKAEELYGVRGEPDPLNPDPDARLKPPPSMSERDQGIYDDLIQLGLNPYRAHVACEFKKDCQECGGLLCPRQCKNDASRICLEPALDKYGAKILAECEVMRLDADEQKVTGIECIYKHAKLTLKAKVIVLAAGSLFSPVLLLKSKSQLWPNGLANSSGQVGRNLMWHASDFIALRPRKNKSIAGPRKAISMNNFYKTKTHKLGTFQSIGVSVTWEYIYSFLKSRTQKGPPWQRLFLRDQLLRFAAFVAAKYFRGTGVFATIVEDLPYSDNCVYADPEAKNGMQFNYNYSQDLRNRTLIFRNEVMKLLRSKYQIFKLTGRNNINFGHPCGTCRFGDNPKTSVLNKFNRTHDIENLYVTDASFFPSSGGTNPSLTIAANALRVAEKILSLELKPNADPEKSCRSV